MFRILFLDDVESRCTQFREALGDHEKNVEITHVETAEEAIELLKEEEFDMIMLDFNLSSHKKGCSPNAMPVAEYLEDSKSRHSRAVIVIHTNCSNAGAEMAYRISSNLALDPLLISGAFNLATVVNGEIAFKIPDMKRVPTQSFRDFGPFTMLKLVNEMPEYSPAANSKAKRKPKYV